MSCVFTLNGNLSATNLVSSQIIYKHCKWAALAVSSRVELRNLVTLFSAKLPIHKREQLKVLEMCLTLLPCLCIMAITFRTYRDRPNPHTHTRTHTQAERGSLHAP